MELTCLAVQIKVKELKGRKIPQQVAEENKSKQNKGEDTHTTQHESITEKHREMIVNIKQQTSRLNGNKGLLHALTGSSMHWQEALWSSAVKVWFMMTYSRNLYREWLRPGDTWMKTTQTNIFTIYHTKAIFWRWIGNIINGAISSTSRLTKTVVLYLLMPLSCVAADTTCR